mmetsp:Transcript_3267/g.10188  ORF Transcript_3267/g.10188 Transcript_3267/m.10188 type:complete len:233 (-) Transcript_3267:146-844(-)
MLRPTPAASMSTMAPSEVEIETSWPKNSATILLPTKPRTSATAGCRYSKSLTSVASTLKRARSPRMANMFDVNATKGSDVTPRTAGTESTAKTTSDTSMHASATRSGVARRTPSAATVQNLSPSIASVVGTIDEHNLTTALFARSGGSFSPEKDSTRIVPDESSRIAAKSSSTGRNASTASTPSVIITSRKIAAAQMPQLRHFFCAAPVTAKKSKISLKTNRLSIDSDSSIT